MNLLSKFFNNTRKPEPFLEKLRNMGYEKAELIDTADKFMDPTETKIMMLSGSALLYGTK